MPLAPSRHRRCWCVDDQRHQQRWLCSHGRRRRRHRAGCRSGTHGAGSRAQVSPHDSAMPGRWDSDNRVAL